MTPTGGLTVLVAGGSPADGETVAGVLTHLGGRTVVAAPGSDAAGLAATTQPDLLVVIAGPHAGPALVSDALAAASWRKPFVLAVVPAADAELAQNFRSAGAHAIAEQPVHPALLAGLAARIRELLVGVASFDPTI